MRVLAVCLAAVSACAAAECVVRPGSILRVAPAPGSDAAPKPSAVLSGTLARPVYDGACRALPEGAVVTAVVDRVEMHPPKPVTGWLLRVAGKAGTPPSVTLGRVTVDGTPVEARFLRTARLRKPRRGRMLLLEVTAALPAPAGASELPWAGEGTVASGTRVRVDLLTALNSRKNRNGDAVRFRVAEPVLAGGRVLVPEGATLEGVVARTKGARRPYRSGKMRLSLRSLRLPGKGQVEAAATPTAGEFENATRLDAEGGLTGGALDRKRALANAAIAYLTGKMLDDLLEESAKAAMGAAVAGSAESAARYVGLASGAAVFLLHRGREVRVDSHTELELTFTRELRVPGASR
jgi:hypothetical protein